MGYNDAFGEVSGKHFKDVPWLFLRGKFQTDQNLFRN
jgi:hypothetical protein